MALLRVIACVLLAVASAQAADLQQRILRLLDPDAGSQAEVLLNNRQFSEVEAMIARTPAESMSAQSEKWAVRGALEFLKGRMEVAVDYFKKAAASNRLQEQDRFTLAMAFVRLGRAGEAREQLARLASEQPNAALYAYWLGRIDYDQRRYLEAIGHLKTATQLDAKLARAWDSLGLAYDMQGKADEALKAFTEAARVNREQSPGSPWPPHDLGALLLRTGRTKEAEIAFREALQYDPHMEEAHYHLGRALEKNGATEEAADEYVAAMKEDPKAADVCYSLAMLYRKMHRDEDARAMFAEWRKRRNAQP